MIIAENFLEKSFYWEHIFDLLSSGGKKDEEQGIFLQKKIIGLEREGRTACIIQTSWPCVDPQLGYGSHDQE